MIIYLILLVISLIILMSLYKFIEISLLYEKMEKSFTDIFVTLRKRKEYLLETYPNDLSLIEFYENSHKLDLKNRLIDELNLRSIDDTFDEYLKEAFNKIDIYNTHYQTFNEYIKSHELLYKLMAYEAFIDLSSLTYH